MNLWESLVGMEDVELTSAEPEKSLWEINSQKIEVFQVSRIDPLTFRFRISRTNHSALQALCRKRGDSLRILRRHGLYWMIKSLCRRPVLAAGVFLLLLLGTYLPTRVMFVRVDGNEQIPSRQILDAAEASGIRFGAARREVRSEKVKNTLLTLVPELQWAGVNTSGCVATVSVRERPVADPPRPKNQVASIVAARDGYILSGTVIRGTPCFRVGQAVNEGQVLISGYTDCGISIQATEAEGEVVAQTIRNITAVTPSKADFRLEEEGTFRRYSLLIGKKRLNLWKGSGNVAASCGRIDKEYFVTLPGGFRLPVALCVEKYTQYGVVPMDVGQQEAELALSAFSDRYLRDQMVAGRILDKTEGIVWENGIYCLDGKYTCEEMIGRVRREQIGDWNGENR